MAEELKPNFEVHDPASLSQARAILTATESPRAWAQAVLDAVKRNLVLPGFLRRGGHRSICSNVMG
jgi:hypothetical protein